jgi:hypothetical protein
MYYSNIVVDNVVRKIPEIFNFHKSDEKAFSKKTKSDEELVDEPFPVEPVYWPIDEDNASVVGFRGAGATCMVHGAGDGIVIQLNTGAAYESFMERRYMQGSVAVSAQSGTVLDNLDARSLWPNVSDNVCGPKLSNKEGAAADAAMQKHVDEGKHVEGVAARLLALALEHSLVPFTQRTRIRNAAASYWCTGKYRSDAIVYSLQNTQAILDWSTPGGVGKDNDPTAVVWVGPADKTRGMSLLSRMMDQGGPILLQESYLLKQFDAGRLLMVGTGTLKREFRSIQPDELMDAIDEALWLLMTYNNLSATFLRNTLRLLIRNLPMVDMTHYREADPIYWRVREGAFGAPELGDGMEAAVDAEIAAAFPDEARESTHTDDNDRARGILSDLFRYRVMTPGGGVDGLAPHTDHAVDWRVLGLLAAMQRPTIGAIDGQSVHHAEFDAAAPPTLPMMAAIERTHLDGLMSCFSGRAGYHLYAYTPPAGADGAPIAAPNGWGVVADPPDDLVIPAGVAHDGVWIEWTGGNDGAGNAHVVAAGMRAYVVRQWIPATADGYMPNYVAPPAQLRRFDLPGNTRMGVRMNGAWPDLNATAPRIHSYIVANARGGNPLDYLSEEGQRAMGGLTNGQRSLALTVGIAYCWDAFGGGRQQNDAYGRWTREHHANRRLTAVPDELKLYVGGIRSRRYVEACGGLWTLCYQKPPAVVSARAGHEEMIGFLRDRSMVASYILKLRCAVEMSDQMCRVANARVAGCYEPFLWPQAVDDRLNRARLDQNTLVDGATYLARQALVMSAVFDHPDAGVARAFSVTACSTMRLREPRQGGAIGLGAIKHMNWLAPQVLTYNTWMLYFGVAAPTFIPDRVCQGWLREARFTTRWQKVNDEFEPGVMQDVEDEAWSAVLTGMVYTDWAPAALEIVAFGSRLLVDVADVRQHQANGLTQPLARLNLPYETRLGIANVRAIGLDAMVRPNLPCTENRNWDDGADLPQSTITYDGRGKVTAVTADANFRQVELLDVRDTPLHQME